MSNLGVGCAHEVYCHEIALALAYLYGGVAEVGLHPSAAGRYLAGNLLGGNQGVRLFGASEQLGIVVAGRTFEIGFHAHEAHTHHCRVGNVLCSEGVGHIEVGGLVILAACAVAHCRVAPRGPLHLAVACGGIFPCERHRLAVIAQLCSHVEGRNEAAHELEMGIGACRGSSNVDTLVVVERVGGCERVGLALV